MGEYFGGISKVDNIYTGLKAILVVPSDVQVPGGNFQYVNWYLGLDTDAYCNYETGDYAIEVGISYGDTNGDSECEWRKFINCTDKNENVKEVISAPNPGDEITIELINRGDGSVSVYIDNYWFGTADFGIPAETGIKIIHALEEFGNDLEWNDAIFKDIQYRKGDSWHSISSYDDYYNDSVITIQDYIPLHTDANCK